jgi:hypothetical protein
MATGLYRDPEEWVMVNYGAHQAPITRKEYDKNGYMPLYVDLPTKDEYDARANGGGDPFREGLDAFGRGIPREECPHPEGTDEREIWQEGWDSGHDLDEDGNPKD